MVKERKTYNNVSMEVNRFAKNKTLKFTYDGDSLTELLTQVPFDKVSIPLYGYRNVVLNNDNLPGNMTVGYIESYNAETSTFNVTIHQNVADKVKLMKNPIIFIRVQAIGEKVTKILGFDICPKAYYAAIR